MYFFFACVDNSQNLDVVQVYHVPVPTPSKSIDQRLEPCEHVVGQHARAKLYVTLFPCNECAKAIIQCGIKELVYMSDKYATSESTIASKKMFEKTGVKYRQYKPGDREITLNI